MTGWLLALILAKGVDVSTTCAARATGQAHEMNPIAPASCERMIGVSAGLIAGESLILWKLDAKHHKAAQALGSAMVGFQVGVDAHNAMVLIQIQRGFEDVRFDQ